jgi:hypothetical protein
MKKIIKRISFSFVIFIITYLIVLYSKNNNEFIETFYAIKIFPNFSLFLSKIFGLFSFSAGEIILVILILSLIYYIIYFVKNPSKKLAVEYSSRIVLTVSIIYFLFWTLWGLNNYRIPLEEYLEYEIEELSIDDLKEAALYIIDEIKILENRMGVDEKNLPVFEVDKVEMLNRSKIYFDAYAESVEYLAKGNYSNPKPMIFSEVMSHLNYTGIYNPFTSEPNVNVNIPYYKIPFVATHEIAHQRGIAGEREANFIAFVVSVESGNDDFIYSAYLSGLIYITNAIYKEDRETYFSVREEFSESIEAVLKDNAEYWDKYNTVIAEIGEKNNNAFLKSTGQPQGTKSYGMVVDFITAYIKDARCY